MKHGFSGTVVPPAYLAMVPALEQGGAIPRTVHHIFFGTALRQDYRDHLRALQAANPDHRFVMHDDATAEGFIDAAFGSRMVSYFRRISPDYPAARSDFLRYLVIYAEGGIYLDLKSAFSAPIRESVSGDESFILTQWRNQPGQPDEGVGLRRAVGGVPDGEFQQWHVIARKGHPYLRAVIAGMLYEIDRYRPWTHLTGRIGVLNVTGPILYSNVIQGIIDRHPHTRYRYDSDINLVYSVIGRNNNVDNAHYSRQRTPVVRLAPHLRAMFVLHRIYTHLLWRLNGKRALVNPDY